MEQLALPAVLEARRAIRTLRCTVCGLDVPSSRYELHRRACMRSVYRESQRRREEKPPGEVIAHPALASERDLRDAARWRGSGS